MVFIISLPLMSFIIEMSLQGHLNNKGHQLLNYINNNVVKVLINASLMWQIRKNLFNPTKCGGKTVQQSLSFSNDANAMLLSDFFNVLTTLQKMKLLDSLRRTMNIVILILHWCQRAVVYVGNYWLNRKIIV